MSITINITGDFVVTDDFQERDLIDGNIIEVFQKADFNIVNLEAPVTSSTPGNKIIKTGPYLRSSEETVRPLLKQLNIELVTLANNHILDYGEEGVEDTLLFCKNSDIYAVGAGMTLSKAQEPFRLNIKGTKISVINFAENEWASATPTAAGANPMDLIDNVKKIQSEKKISDFVIVIIHGGHEYYRLPSPRMVKQYRFYAESGANIVVGHHTHCISGYEEFNGVPIYYGLGNFLFTKSSVYDDWYTGLFLEIDISNGNLFSKLHPIKQDKNSFKVTLLENSKRKDVLDSVENLRSIIINESRLLKDWNDYALSKYDEYLARWSPTSFIGNRYIRSFIKKTNLYRFLSSRAGLALYLNLMRCESHVDLSKTIIKRYLK